MADISESRPSLNIGVNVDCSEAITVFKALQREIKETIKNVKELESSFASLSVDGINVKGGKIDKTFKSHHTFERKSRYLVIDFGEDPKQEEISLHLTGYNKISRMYQTDTFA